MNFTYVSDDFYRATLYGGSLIVLASPYRFVQISAELEELRANQSFTDRTRVDPPDFWNTALFLGLGYRTGPVTFGVRYNVLYKEKDRVYNEAFQPFVRVYF